MLFFYNPGLIDLDAVRTMGASVKLPNSFGMFGTGIKYGIATILRGGGSVTLYRGADKHEFSTETREIRGEPFYLVCLDGESMGFTTALGRNWKPWMVLREFGCNARDEGGDFASTSEGRGLADFQSVDQTVFQVQWDALEDAYRQRGDLFLEGEPLYEDEKLRILPGPSRHLFYRGVRVFELEKPAAYSYDILEEQMLTEDRTLYGAWSADVLIRDAVLRLTDKTTLEAVVCAGGGYHEGGFNYEEVARYTTPSRAFLETVVEAREAGRGNLNESAKRVLMKHMRKAAESESYGGYASYRATHDAFSYATDVLDELGVKFGEETQFITIDELPGEALSMVEGGRVYIHHDLLRLPSRDIALELLKRWIDLSPVVTADQAVELLGPLLINQHPQLKRVEKIVEEDASLEEQAEANAALAPEPVE
jgi:hypothetical protein